MTGKDIEAIRKIFGDRFEPVEKKLTGLDLSVREHTKLLAGMEPRVKAVEERSKSNSNKIWAGVITLCGGLFAVLAWFLRSTLEWVAAKINGGI
jgi:hypothetical protein